MHNYFFCLDECCILWDLFIGQKSASYFPGFPFDCSGVSDFKGERICLGKDREVRFWFTCLKIFSSFFLQECSRLTLTGMQDRLKI